jgi:hypothetical protein
LEYRIFEIQNGNLHVRPACKLFIDKGEKTDWGVIKGERECERFGAEKR